MDKYIDDYRNTRQLYNDAVNNYDIAQDNYESTLYAMENKYYNNIKDFSRGSTYCFHVAPQGLHYNDQDHKNYLKLFHCYDCGYTRGLDIKDGNQVLVDPAGKLTPDAYSSTCPNCNSDDVVLNDIYIPIYDDFSGTYSWNAEPYTSMYPYGTADSKGGYRYNPHLKGYFQRLVTALDRVDNYSAQGNEKDIAFYESKVSMIEGIPFDSSKVTLDGYDYKLDNIYVRTASGQIEV